MKLDISLFLMIILLFQLRVDGAFSNCKPYKIIPVEDYDKDPKSVTDTSKHPNGFYYGSAKYPGTATNLQNICVYLTNLTGRAVEVMVQPFLSGNKICVKDDGGDSECRESISRCFEAHSDRMNYEFYCDPGNSCDSDVQFWYRLVPSEGDKDDWCTLIRSGNDFPSSLLPVPTQLPTDKDDPKAGSSAIVLSVMTFMVTMAMVFLFTKL